MKLSSFLVIASATVTLAQVESQYTATGTAAIAAAKATAKTSSPVSYVKGKKFDRLVIIWNENTDYDLAVNDPNLAYLGTKGVTLSNYHAVTHPSEPNYVASVGGDYFGIDNDNFNFIDKNISSVVNLLEAHGITWGEYQEDMPYSGFEGKAYVNQQNGANDYVRKHNPEVHYSKVSSKLDSLSRMKNITTFYKDLAANTLPQWMFITPNMTSDGHDTSVTVAGTWTRNFLEPLLNDKNFMNNTLVLVTFDENSSYEQQNRILGILLGDAVPASLVGTTDSNFYNHYSEIASVSANWDLPTLGRWDVGANVFGLVATATGDKIREWSTVNGAAPLTSMYFNESYDGVFNDAAKFAVYPAPNLTAVSPSGRKVSENVSREWQGSKNPTYYTDRLEVNDGMHPPSGYSGGGYAA